MADGIVGIDGCIFDSEKTLSANRRVKHTGVYFLEYTPIYLQKVLKKLLFDSIMVIYIIILKKVKNENTIVNIILNGRNGGII